MPRLRLLSLSLFALCLHAGQIVKLQSGQTLRVDRADQDGDQVFLTVANNVSILSASEVLSIEPEPDPNKPKPAPKPAPADPRAATKELLRNAARNHGLPAAIVESIAEVESGLRTQAVSHKGAIGVMQLMPGTARHLGVDPTDVEQNIEGGTRYLRELLIKYQHSPNQIALALAAYNAGPGAVQRYQGIPPYQETQQYVRKVLNRFDQKTATEPPTAPAYR
jgi:soluble lytic murein transglycosylase-like protein